MYIVACLENSELLLPTYTIRVVATYGKRNNLCRSCVRRKWHSNWQQLFVQQRRAWSDVSARPMKRKVGPKTTKWKTSCSMLITDFHWNKQAALNKNDRTQVRCLHSNQIHTTVALYRMLLGLLRGDKNGSMSKIEFEPRQYSSNELWFKWIRVRCCVCVC